MVDVSKLSKKGQKIYTEFSHLPLKELLEKGLSDKDYEILSAQLSQEPKKETATAEESNIPKKIEPIQVQVGVQQTQRNPQPYRPSTQSNAVTFRDKKTGRTLRMGTTFYNALASTNKDRYEIIFNG